MPENLGFYVGDLCPFDASNLDHANDIFHRCNLRHAGSKLVLSAWGGGWGLAVDVWDDESGRLRVSDQLLGLGEVEAGVYGAMNDLHGHGLKGSQCLLILNTRLCEND